MRKMKGRYLLIIVLSALAIITAAVLLAIFAGREANKDGVSRYEWAKILSEEFSLEANAKERYFSDVKPSSEYDPYVQAIGQWKIVEEKKFEGDKPVDAGYAAVTLLKAIGINKVKVYLEKTGDLDEDALLKLAFDEGLLDDENDDRKLTRAECDDLLEKARDFQYKADTKQGYEHVVYKEGVVDLTDRLVLKEGENSVSVENENLNEGDIILLRNEWGGQTWKRITGMNADKTANLTDVDPAQVLEEAQVADVRDITFEDFLKGGDWDSIEYDVFEPAATNRTYEMAPLKYKAGEAGFNNFDISVTVAPDHLKISTYCKDLKIRANKQIPMRSEVLSKDTTLKLHIDELKMKYQADYETGDLHYLDVALSERSTVSGDVKLGGVSKKFRILEPQPVAAIGPFTLSLGLYITVNAKGQISLSVDIPANFGFLYEKNKGVRSDGAGIKIENFKITAEVSGELWGVVELVPGLGPGSIIDIEGAGGASISAKAIPRAGANDIILCSEVELTAPMFKIMVGDDDDEAKLVKTVTSLLGILDEGSKFEIMILDKDKAPIHDTFHFEMKRDLTIEGVDKCTYEGLSLDLGEDNPTENLGREINNRYGAEQYLQNYSGFQFEVAEMKNGYMEESSWKDEGEYYEVRGYIRSPNVLITAGKANGSDGEDELAGQTVEIYGHTLKLGEAEEVGYNKSFLNGFEGIKSTGSRKAIPVLSIDGKNTWESEEYYFLYGPFAEPERPHYYDRYVNKQTRDVPIDSCFWALCIGDGDYYDAPGLPFDEKLDCAWYAAGLDLNGISDRIQTIRIAKDAVFAIPASDMETERLIPFADVYTGKNSYSDVSEFYDYFSENEYGWHPIARAKISIADDGMVNEIVPMVVND